MRVVVLAKDKPGLPEAVRFLKQNSDEVVVAVGTRLDPFPEGLFETPTDFLVSYLSPWIVPEKILKIIKEKF